MKMMDKSSVQTTSANTDSSVFGKIQRTKIFIILVLFLLGGGGAFAFYSRHLSIPSLDSTEDISSIEERKVSPLDQNPAVDSLESKEVACEDLYRLTLPNSLSFALKGREKIDQDFLARTKSMAERDYTRRSEFAVSEVTEKDMCLYWLYIAYVHSKKAPVIEGEIQKGTKEMLNEYVLENGEQYKIDEVTVQKMSVLLGY